MDFGSKFSYVPTLLDIKKTQKRKESRDEETAGSGGNSIPEVKLAEESQSVSPDVYGLLFDQAASSQSAVARPPRAPKASRKQRAAPSGSSSFLGRMKNIFSRRSARASAMPSTEADSFSASDDESDDLDEIQPPSASSSYPVPVPVSTMVFAGVFSTCHADAMNRKMKLTRMLSVSAWDN